jgi:MFS family permease
VSDHQGVNRWRLLSAVLLGSIMGPIDASVVHIAIPVIARDFGADPATIGWVSMAYLLVLGSLLLAFGRMGDVFGFRRIFLAGLLAFVLTSALCGLAPNLGALILLRALQAGGAGMMMAMAPAIITAAFPPQERGRALGMNGTVIALGLGWFVAAEKRSPEPLLDFQLFPLTVLVVAPLAGALSDRIGQRGLAFAGSLICTIAALLLAALGQHSDTGDVAWRLSLFGLGTGLFQSPNWSAVMGSVPRFRLGIAGGVLGATRNVGMVLGIALGGAILTARRAAYLHMGPVGAFLAALREAYLAAVVVSLVATVACLWTKLAQQE